MKSLSQTEQTYLNVWRGGAVWTPTRRWCRPGVDDPRTECTCCPGVRASARHYWAECLMFAPRRSKLDVEYRMPVGWWRAQPRVTAKSGWVTFAAASSLKKRARRQVAACQMGIAIVAAAPELKALTA